MAAAVVLPLAFTLLNRRTEANYLRTEAHYPDQAIENVVVSIRRLAADPARQVQLVNLAANTLIDYGDVPYVATLSQAIEIARNTDQPRPVGDCRTRALVAGQMLAALKIPHEYNASWILGHMTVVVPTRNGAYELSPQEFDSPFAPWWSRFLYPVREFYVEIHRKLGGDLAAWETALPVAPPPFPSSVPPAVDADVYYADTRSVGFFGPEAALARARQIPVGTP